MRLWIALAFGGFREWVLPLDEQHMVTRGEGNTEVYYSTGSLSMWDVRGSA